jgi:hypothetical protein
MKPIIACAGVWLVCLCAAEACAATAHSCGTLTVGPTATRTGSSGAGPSCMLAAFERCRAARYTLSSFGVDTIAATSFTIVRHGAVCAVSVAVSLRVVPQQPRSTGSGTCQAIGRRGGDIVATGCRGAGLADVIPLSGA